MKGSPSEVIGAHRDKLKRIHQLACFYSADRVPKLTRKFSGQSRASINMGVGSPDNRVVLVENYRKNAIQGELAAATRRFKQVSSGIGVSDTVYISSALDYSPIVECKLGDLSFTKSSRLWQQDVDRATRNA